MKNRQRILKTLSFLLVLSLLSASFCMLGAVAAEPASNEEIVYGDTWDGSVSETPLTAVEGKTNTYYINSGAELALLASNVNAGNTYEGYTFLITKNIDLNKQAWTPIGNATAKPFNGTLQGALNGVEGEVITIGNMYINSSVARLALVGTQNGGGIHDITMVDADVTQTGNHTAASFVGSNDSGTVSYSNLKTVNFTLNVTAKKSYFGAIVGVTKVASRWENCTVEGFNMTTNNKTIAYIGGFIGQNQTDAATFINCSVSDFTLSKAGTGNYLGGFIGCPLSGTTFEDCAVDNFKLYGATEDASVSSTYVGGFSGGGATYPSFTRCSATNIDLKLAGAGSSTAQLVGGFTGMVRNGTDTGAIFNTVSTSGTITVTGTAGKQFGGLVGIIRNNATLTNCISDVDLVFTEGGASNVGGLVGNVFSDAAQVTFTGCDFTGSITSPLHENVGGLIGINIGAATTLMDCETSGTISITTPTNVGAMVGAMTDGTNNGALTMENCTATASDYEWFGIDTATADITLKSGDATVVYDTLTVKYQTKDDGNDATETFRLIATVNGDALETYESVGFLVTNKAGKQARLSSNTVYKTILGDDKVWVPSAAGEGQESCGYGEASDYFFAVNMENVPMDEPFTVQAFVVIGGVTVLGEAYTFTVADLIA